MIFREICGRFTENHCLISSLYIVWVLCSTVLYKYSTRKLQHWKWRCNACCACPSPSRSDIVWSKTFKQYRRVLSLQIILSCGMDGVFMNKTCRITEPHMPTSKLLMQGYRCVAYINCTKRQPQRSQSDKVSSLLFNENTYPPGGSTIQLQIQVLEVSFSTDHML